MRIEIDVLDRPEVSPPHLSRGLPHISFGWGIALLLGSLLVLFLGRARIPLDLPPAFFCAPTRELLTPERFPLTIDALVGLPHWGWHATHFFHVHVP